MALSEVKDTTPNYATYESLRNTERYLNEEIRRLRKQIKLIMAVLVDKKMLTENMLKAFEESKQEEVNESIVDWFMKKQVKKDAS